MSTVVKLGPADQGRAMTLEEYLAGEYCEGYRYELIDGRLNVSPAPSPPGRILESWILACLYAYVNEHPEVANFTCPGPRVFVPGQPVPTAPEPDAALYHNFPLNVDFRDIRWQDHSPILVVEVLDEDNPEKDLDRNAGLYHRVPSVREYWVIDPRPDPNQPTLLAHRRWGGRWRIVSVPYGETYTTRLLPGFELVVDPRR